MANQQGQDERKGEMTVEEAGHMGGQREKELVQEGHMKEGEMGMGSEEKQKETEEMEDM